MRIPKTPSLAACLPLLVLGACGGGKGGVGGIGSGPEKDARLVTDVYSWECNGGADGGTYQGVFQQVNSLEFAPDALRVVPLPSPGGCTAGLNMFPENAGEGGTAVPGVSGDIEWENDADDGYFVEMAAGFYQDDVFPDTRTCTDINDVLLGGTRLVNAGSLEGVSTPSPQDIPAVEFSGLSVDPDTNVELIQFGDEITASWDDHDWDRVWVQVRRELDGTTWESVTCNATGLDSFTLDDAVWTQLDPNIDVDQNQLYVGFEAVGEEETVDGYKVETAIRAMALAVVQD